MKEVMVKETNNFVLLDVDLHSFDEGAAAGASSSEGSQADGTSSNGGVASTSTEEKQTVIYGKQSDEDSNVDTKQEGDMSEEATSPDLSAEFEKLIGKDGQYKSQFDERVQSIINRRFKEMKGLEKQIGDSQPILDLLMEKHGVDNTNALYEKLESEIINELAYESNMTPEEIRAARENTAKAKLYDDLMKNQKVTQEREQQMQQNLAKWQQESEALQQIYPDFNLSEASDNREFVQLLGAGVDVKTAYEVINFDSIKADTARQAQSNAAKATKQKKSRPAESAAQKSNNGVIVKSNAKDLTKVDRAEIIKRAARGEIISF